MRWALKIDQTWPRFMWNTSYIDMIKKKMCKCKYSSEPPWLNPESKVTSFPAQHSGGRYSVRWQGILILMHCFCVTIRSHQCQKVSVSERLTEVYIEPVLPRFPHSAIETWLIHSVKRFTLVMTPECVKRRTRTSTCSELSCTKVVSRFLLHNMYDEGSVN